MKHLLSIILIISGFLSCVQAAQAYFDMTRAKRQRTDDVDDVFAGKSIITECGHFVPVSYMENAFKSGPASCTAKCPSCEHSMSYLDYVKKLVNSGVPEGVICDMNRVSKKVLIPYIRDLIEDNDTYSFKNILKLKIPIQDLEIAGTEGNTILDEAAQHSQDMFQILLEGGVRFSKAQIEGSFMKFFNVIAQGGKNTLLAQIESGFDVNMRVGDGDTLLHRFIDNNRPEMVAILLQNGARTDILSSFTGLPLHLAIQHDNPDVLRLIIDAKPNYTAVDPWSNCIAFAFACTQGKINAVKMLLGIKEARADAIFGLEPNTYNILHMAILKGHVEVVEYMLNQGFSIYTKKHVPSFMLHRVVQAKNNQMLKMLLKKGASVYEPTFQNVIDLIKGALQNVPIDYRPSDPPAVMAVLSRSHEALEILLQNGFSANTRIHGNTSTLLHLACRIGNYPAVTILVKYGADLNAVDSMGFKAVSLSQNHADYYQATNYDNLV